MTTPLRLSCARCAREMLTYDRAGVHVDPCRECRGVFLDRGEPFEGSGDY